jgi:CelD/BcsL family acetyltransferase involved in cellulose biosynthesis
MPSRNSVSSPSPSICIEVAASAAAIAALADDWRKLETETPEATGFQNYDWCNAWMEAAASHGDRRAFRILCLRESGRLVMLWPLQIEKFFGVRVARWLGEPMTQYGDALASPGADRARRLGIALDEISRWRDVDLLALTRMREDGVLANSGLKATPHGEALAAPFVDLRKAEKKKPGKSAARRARMLATLGELRLEETRTPRGRLEITRHALTLKRDWLRAKGFISAGLSHPLTAAFLERFSQIDASRIHALEIGGEPGAIDIGFVSRDAYRSLIGAYDPRFAQGAPGHALSERLIEYFTREGYASYDFLAPADPYKLAFASGQIALFAHFNARNPAGEAAGFVLKWLRPAAKRLLAKLNAVAPLRFIGTGALPK